MKKKAKTEKEPWQGLMRAAVRKMLDSYGYKDEHTLETPKRYVEALEEYLSGCHVPPFDILKGFEETKYNQMIFVNDISFISHCAHHLAPFAGKMHFAYIPNKTIVGLSKIPRLIENLTHRLQIQEQLSDAVVDMFMREVHPKGCGIIVEAVHFCMCARGVKKTGSYTRTASLRGNFYKPTTKEEFLAGAVSKGSVL